MGDVIDFKPKHKVEVSLEDEEQRLLEAGIVSLWEVIDGLSLKELIDDELAYLFLFLQFSGVCFDNMVEENIIIDEDGNMGITSDLREALQDAIKDIKRELTANDNSPE